MSYSITLEPEQIDAIVIGELKQNIDSLEHDLKFAKKAKKAIDANHTNDDDYLGVFVHDPYKDVEEIQKHIDALKLIVDFYGGWSTQF